MRCAAQLQGAQQEIIPASLDLHLPESGALRAAF